MSDFTIVKLLDGLNIVNIPSGLVPKGAYDNATDYAVGDSVDYLGSSYVMFVDAAAGTLPTDTTKWQVIAIGHEKATGAEIDTGTDDLKYATAKAITDSKLSFVDGTETLTNKTLTSPKINEDVILTSSATELNVLDGIPATLTATELGYVDGVTSAIQTQLGTKAPSTAPTFATSITGSYLTASEILGTGASKEIVSLPVATYPSLTELSYVKGLSSAIQTQLGNKAATDQTMYIGTTQVAINRASAALTLAGLTLTTPDIGTPSAGVLTNATGLPAASVLAGSLGTGAYVMDTSLTVPLINGSSAANGDITINGTSSATKTTSYVILQATGGNVGIGTTAPGGNLHIQTAATNGTIVRAVLVQNNGAGTNTGTSIELGYGQTAESGGTAGLNGYYDGTGPALGLFSGGSKTQYVTLTSAGNVGIGTTNPGARLDVLGTTRHVLIGDWTTNNGYSAMSFGGTLGTDANLYGAGGQLFINRATGSDISFRENNGTDQVTIKTGGNVGIGTTNPGSKLDVVGLVRSQVANNSVAFRAINTDNSNRVFYELQSDADGDAQMNMFNLNEAQTILLHANGNSYINGGNLGIGYADPGTAKLAVNGNVGIGTTAPGQRLEVSGASPKIKIAATDVSGDTQLIFEPRTNTGVAVTNSYISSNWQGDGMVFRLPRDIDTHGYKFRNNAGTDLMYINSTNGNVGIGTTSPTAKLHLPACTATANTASAKIEPGTVATTPVSGNIESDGTHLYWTDSSGTRKQLDN